jgi:hypothetical protein
MSAEEYPAATKMATTAAQMGISFQVVRRPALLLGLLTRLRAIFGGNPRETLMGHFIASLSGFAIEVVSRRVVVPRTVNHAHSVRAIKQLGQRLVVEEVTANCAGMAHS